MRSTVRVAATALALVAVLGAWGCSKKQVRQEGEVISQAPEAGESRPTVRPSPGPTVRETPLRPRPSAEPPPPETAAVEPAPEPAVRGEGVGLPQETSPGLQRIHFDFDQSVLSPEARDVLAGNADYLTRNPGIRVRIEGHCDERGTTEYNLALGERRAKSAYQYLMDLGVDPNRMTVVSYGEEVPLDPRHNEEAWAQNRRAEFVEIGR